MGSAREPSALAHGKPDEFSTKNAIPDSELQSEVVEAVPSKVSKSAYADLGWLDRLLALWILMAIVIGILLGNFVDGVEQALQKGKFVQVSVLIGMSSNIRHMSL